MAKNMLVPTPVRWLLHCRVFFKVLGFLPSIFKPVSLVKLFRSAFIKYAKVQQGLFGRKARLIGGKYYWNLYLPGFPSSAFRQVVKTEIRTLDTEQPAGGVATLVFAITKKCALSCEHCFEWNDINGKEHLDEKGIRAILDGYLDTGGIGQVIFSGGEPLNRFPLLKRLVADYHNRCDMWIATSGLGLTTERAKQLKDAGLTGVIVSLDHFDAMKHDNFRGFKGSWQHAIDAVKNAVAESLVTTVSVCPAKGGVNRDFFDRYMLLARQLKVTFVQIIEPRAEGRYKHQDVLLGIREKELLAGYFRDYNTAGAYTDFPIVMYPDHNRRQFGCPGGKRSFYVDTNGTVSPCPFCKKADQACNQKKLVIA